MLYRHPYYCVTRSIKDGQQLYEEEELYLILSEDKITTNSNVFMLEHVFDLSYRKTAELYGFLYLHTNKGVFSFNVKHAPDELIRTFRSLK
ncbi:MULTISPECIES: hypothetical protein [Pontibacillus]|uniref:YokE-like PH domain-containing protein n=1 Tax=Pontibacillus chungwhensis TaxID=265426 RepID=A0ABY8UW56_9BACI|nr:MULTISPECIES: hypothetical protein [Pontibacillus]MCD5323272.1 hypothetical protein [Pontibacillus sp. HN14]WIF96655.1 hypothetical protein QNI29_12945 [Pontibacillus chungwhensis]